MKVTLTITDIEPGQVDIAIDFDPPIDTEDTQHTTASSLAVAVLDYLKDKATAQKEEQ